MDFLLSPQRLSNLDLYEFENVNPDPILAIKIPYNRD